MRYRSRDVFRVGRRLLPVLTTVSSHDTQGSPAQVPSGLHVRDYHPLWFNFSGTFRFSGGVEPEPTTPHSPTVSRGGSVCPLPVSLAVTKGIPFGFFSSPYYDVSVRGVPIPSPYGLGTYAIIGRILEVLFGDLRIEACLRLPAAFPSLPGPSSAPEPSRPPSGGCVSDLT